jgi:hypothetical protein
VIKDRVSLDSKTFANESRAENAAFGIQERKTTQFSSRIILSQKRVIRGQKPTQNNNQIWDELLSNKICIYFENGFVS